MSRIQRKLVQLGKTVRYIVLTGRYDGEALRKLRAERGVGRPFKKIFR